MTGLITPDPQCSTLLARLLAAEEAAVTAGCIFKPSSASDVVMMLLNIVCKLLPDIDKGASILPPDGTKSAGTSDSSSMM